MEKGLNFVIVQLFERLLHQDALTHCMKNTLTTSPGAPEYEDVIIKRIMTTQFRDTPYPEAPIYNQFKA